MFGIFLKLLPKPLRTGRYIRALERGDTALAARLLRTGLDLQAALSPTLRLGSALLLRQLLLRGANPNREVGQQPALIQARLSPIDPAEKVQALFDAGVNPNGRIGQFSVLVYAIRNRDELLARLLLKNGASARDRDPAGFTPVEMAHAVEEAGILDLLRSAGAESAKLQLREFEAVFVNPSSFISELHELVKWAIRNSAFELDDVTVPRPRGEQDFFLRYRFHSGAIRLRIELEFLSQSEIAMLLYEGDSATPLCSLVPGVERLDSSRLRGHVVTILVDFKKAGKFTAAPEMEKILTPSERAALETLGLSASATGEQIMKAYRSLAKRYHPDLGAGSGEKMVRINEAYERLTKKRS